MIFSYLALPTKRPVPSLAGAMVRYRPIVPVRLIGPLSSRVLDGCVDSGSDDTIFPRSLASKLGTDRTSAPQGEARPVGGAKIPYAYAAVTLRFTDGIETCEWRATVGFVDLPLRWALLGLAGFLDFFDVELRGDRREAFMSPNGRFAASHSIKNTP